MDMLSNVSALLNFCYNVTYIPGVRGTGIVDMLANHSTPISMGISSITITAARYAVCNAFL